MKLSGKVAVVTGGSRGIGLAIAESLAVEGASVIITGRNTNTLEEAADRLRGRGHTVASQECDVRSEASVRALFEAVRTMFGHMEILVNNAGIAHELKKVEELPPATWTDVITTNLTGMYLCTHFALPLLQQGGVIVNNLSIAARRDYAGFSAYNASKAGAEGFTRTLRAELRERSIRVIALIPGATETTIWNQFWDDAPRADMVEPDTVAASVVHAICLPPKASMDEIIINPSVGEL